MKIFEAIEAEKQIDKTPILKKLSLSINKGERVAITGHNGSGKSSLLKLIGGIFEPTAGNVIRSSLKIGYVPEHFPENIRFRLMEYLLLIGKMSGKREGLLLEKIGEYAKHFAIKEFLNTPLKSCSKGTKQKAGIIQALLLEPDLLLLDEPLTGLDEKTQNELLKQLDALRSMTIIFTVHDSFLIDGLANRIITVANGRIISDVEKDKKEKERIITAVADKEIISEISCLSMKYIGNSSFELTVLAVESDTVLAILLNKGCSILDLREKR